MPVANGNGHRKDRLFIYVMGAAFLFLMLFGVGVVVVSLIREPQESVSLRVVSALSSMFASLIGVAFGYLVGRNGR